jgi:hypothetical protein
MTTNADLPQARSFATLIANVTSASPDEEVWSLYEAARATLRFLWRASPENLFKPDKELGQVW